MREQGSLLGFLSDPRLAPYATGDIPAWLWSADATRILWGNPAAAAIFNAASSTALTGHTIDPKGSAALQIARLAGTLPHGAAPRLERLRGFGGRMGGALMCGCSRISLADRTPAILVVATEAAGPASFARPSRRSVCSPAATNRSRCLRPTARCCTRRRRRRPGSAAPKPRRARRSARSAPRRSPPAAPKASMRDGRISIERIGADASTALLVDLCAAAAAPSPASRSRRPRQSTAAEPTRARAGHSRSTCRRRRRLPPPRAPNQPRNTAAAKPQPQRPAANAGRAPPTASLRLADGRRRPLHPRLRRIQGADRAADRRRPRPAVERYRNRAGARSRRPGRARLRLARHLERHHRRLPGGRQRHAACRSNCPGFRCSTATAISAAIAASAFAATSRASTS